MWLSHMCGADIPAKRTALTIKEISFQTYHCCCASAEEQRQHRRVAFARRMDRLCWDLSDPSFRYLLDLTDPIHVHWQFIVCAHQSIALCVQFHASTSLGGILGNTTPLLTASNTCCLQSSSSISCVNVSQFDAMPRSCKGTYDTTLKRARTTLLLHGAIDFSQIPVLSTFVRRRNSNFTMLCALVPLLRLTELRIGCQIVARNN